MDLQVVPMKPVQFFLLFLVCAFAEAVLPCQGSTQPDVHLAVHPQCGPLWGNVSDVNAGLNLAKMKTIVSFGVRARLLPLSWLWGRSPAFCM